ncbi:MULTISPECIES: hypothetical protein [unclassified Nostoc]|uniref:hypothetical protein n=1 Tax=unclassified Nostoc TaxID=2593658 RepID=UPI0025D94606|nr:hypothetical protein [Nostoc sp. JL33]MBN3872931.1 hypothetical protein [Nostoc sp. JL33]
MDIQEDTFILLQVPQMELNKLSLFITLKKHGLNIRVTQRKQEFLVLGYPALSRRRFSS